MLIEFKALAAESAVRQPQNTIAVRVIVVFDNAIRFGGGVTDAR